MELPTEAKRWAYAVWVVVIGAFAVMHAVNLSADFPNHSPWWMDWAKYTDEGWYANAAVRAHLFGNWYVPGDFNPAPAVPVWPFLVWVLFFVTGVKVEAARGLAIAFYFANLLLVHMVLRGRTRRWVGMLALTMMVTSPFLYCFSRLAILEPMLTTLMLTILNIAVRMPRWRRQMGAAAVLGVLFTLMILTKTTAVFLLPAIGWAMLAAFWSEKARAVRVAAVAMGAFLLTFGGWMALVVHSGLWNDYKYLFFINKYIKPTEWYWPALSFWWSIEGSMWIDRVLVPLAFVLLFGVLVMAALRRADGSRARMLLLDPVFGSAVLAGLGYILFMTYQNHPQPRYFAFVAVFCFVVVAMAAGALVEQAGAARLLGGAALAVAVAAVIYDGEQTAMFVAHPEYTFVTAARNLTRYIDEHPNGNRQLVSISGDEISLVTHLPALCDDFGTPTRQLPDLPAKLAHYQPGWWATWNDIDPGTLEDLHVHYSLEQVATLHAFDNSDRDALVLFKLHPLPNGQTRQIQGANLQVPLPEDKILIDVQ